MKGYWGRPDRTAEVLVPDPFGGSFPDPVYRTGDLVIERSDGDYDFVGRRDNQVKSRGYRIELGEIEACLRAHPSVVECVVVAVPDPEVTNTLRAYVAATRSIDATELVAFCGERIPSYMIPDVIEVRDELPRTSTGKADRSALLRSGMEGPEH